MVTLILLSTSSTVRALGASVNIYPATIPTGLNIYIDIEPYTEAYGLLVVVGPFDEDMNPVGEYFHLDYILILDDPLIADNEVTFTYPIDSEWTPYDPNNNEPFDPNTDHVGVYIVAVMLAGAEPDPDLVMEILFSLLTEGEWPNISGYEYGWWVQITVASIFVIPEIFSTLIGVAVPFFALGVKIKRSRLIR